MLELPASVRIALWATHAWNRHGALPEVLPNALPDVDHVAGDVATLEMWHALGERAVLVALPSPGHLNGLPRAGAEVLDAAVDAGECVIAPALGGVLVPVVAPFGHGKGADSGTRIDFVAYDADPVPQHLVAALDGSMLERHLREDLIEATESLDGIGGQPFSGRMAREAADVALDGDWGLPPELPARLLRVISLAATTGRVAQIALDQPDDGLDSATITRRRDILRRLHHAGESVLADATNAACAAMAGWVPSLR